ncbi:MAG TPA: DNA recombination protein RmuC [Saprospiraceae bacterium]|nr:DNA recombination protein RmuC [Saprospiraceae bacterium]HRK83888.1 DNA recombination protein RmuC [Saprospiraceae bacterium]
MEATLTISLLFLLIGLVIGALSAWMLARFKSRIDHLPKSEVQAQFVAKEVHEAALQQNDLLRDELISKEEQLRELTGQTRAQEQSMLHLREKLEEQRHEMLRLQERFQTEFENVANRLLEEKSQKFSAHNQQQIGELLHPLREKIKTFEENIERRFVEETRDRVSLKKEIEQLRDLNRQLSQDANNLAGALKGDNKAQGDWGEMQLELLLERAGLAKDIHYSVQSSFADEEGRQKRPDCIIHLPDSKHLIIDSKVSLTAYERFFSSQEPEEQKKHLAAHVDSMRRHIRELSEKNYTSLYQINSPDYLLLFVPLESAFNVALQQDSRLFLDALDRNIVIVTTSTLLATMRTVAFIWKQDKQKRSVMEIARQSGLLYDKFVAFVEDLRGIGQRLDSAQQAYHDAMLKLSDARRPGDTLIGKAEKIRELGAKTSKQLPKELTDGGE